MIELVKALAWPVTVIWLVVKLYQPIIELVRTVGQRVSKLKLFDLEFEFGKLVPASASLSIAVEALQQGMVQGSGSASIVTGITKSATADYLPIALGTDDDHAWITSRLFLLSALIDRNRIVRCMVFTGERGAFIGAASPRDVRGEIGTKYPEYERALLGAYAHVSGWDLQAFRYGMLSEDALSAIARSFVSSPLISSPVAPVASGWIFLNRPPPSSSTWELADYVTAGLLRTMLRNSLSQGAVVGTAGALQSEDVNRAILNQTGPFVALVGDSGEFRELCDRMLIADKIARRAAGEATSA